MIGDRLYELSPRDVQARQLSPFFERVVLTSVGLTLFAQIEAAEGFALILKTVHGSMNPAAAQSSQFLQLSILPQTGIGIDLDAARYAVVPATLTFLTWNGELIIPEGTAIRMRGDFDVGAAANTIILSVHGWMIPLGNLQRT